MAEKIYLTATFALRLTRHKATILERVQATAETIFWQIVEEARKPTDTIGSERRRLIIANHVDLELELELGGLRLADLFLATLHDSAGTLASNASARCTLLARHCNAFPPEWQLALSSRLGSRGQI